MTTALRSVGLLLRLAVLGVGVLLGVGCGTGPSIEDVVRDIGVPDGTRMIAREPSQRGDKAATAVYVSPGWDPQGAYDEWLARATAAGWESPGEQAPCSLGPDSGRCEFVVQNASRYLTVAVRPPEDVRPEYASELEGEGVVVLVQLRHPVATDKYPGPFDALAWVLPVVVLLIAAGLLWARRARREARDDRPQEQGG